MLSVYVEKIIEQIKSKVKGKNMDKIRLIQIAVF